MANTGIIISMPTRRLVRSPSQPTIGRISRPGITHSDATEKPTDRARGGMARASVARMPGSSTERMPFTAMFAATARPTVGARAKATLATPTARQACDRKPARGRDPSPSGGWRSGPRRTGR